MMMKEAKRRKTNHWGKSDASPVRRVVEEAHQFNFGQGEAV